MPNITPTQQTQVFQIVTGLFNAAPNAAYLAALDNLVSGGLGGITALQLAQTLAGSSAFTAGIMGGKTTPAAQVQQLMSNFGLTYATTPVAGTAAGDAQNWFASQIAANRGFGDIIYDAVTYLSNPAWVATLPEFTSVAATLNNKIAVATYYSSLPGNTSSNLVELQAVLAGVTSATAVATTANLAAAVALGISSSSSSGPSYPLTVGVDNIPGAAGGDNFNATYSDGLTQTFNATDTLVGGRGINSLNITSDPSNPSASTTLGDALWAHVSNIKNVNVTTNAGAINISTGANFNSAFATGVALAATTGNAPITIDMGTTPFTGTATITAVSAAGAQNITTGSGLTTVTATSNGGAETISGAGLNLVTATTLGAGAQSISSSYTGDVTVNATAATGVQTITTRNTGLASVTATATANAQSITTGAGNAFINATSAAGGQTIATGAGNDTIIAASGTGAQSITTGAGNDVIVASSANTSGNTITVGAGSGSINLNGAGYTVTIGAAGSTFATAPSYIVTGAVGGDVIAFANDTASSNAALTSLGASSISAIEAAAVALGAHGVAYGTVNGNTYIAEELAAGAASGTNTSLIEILGAQSLTAATGHVTIVGPVTSQTTTYTPTPPPVYAANFYPLTTANDTINPAAAGGDHFDGTWTDGSAASTFNVGDVLVGGSGTNTLNITSAAAGAMTLTGANFSTSDANITHFNITNTTASAITFDGSTATNPNFTHDFGTSTIYLTTSTGGGATTINMTGNSGTEIINATSTDATAAGTISITTGSGPQNVTAISKTGDITITGSASNANNSFTAISTGAGAVTVTCGGAGSGTGSNTVTATSVSGPVTVTAGATASGNIDNITVNSGSGTGTINAQLGVTTEIYNIMLGAHTAANTISVSVIAGTTGAANTFITGALAGDKINIADGASTVVLSTGAGSQQAAITALSSLALAVAYVDNSANVNLPAHAATAFTWGGNTYLLETVSGSALDAGVMAAGNTLVELVGIHTITAAPAAHSYSLAS